MPSIYETYSRQKIDTLYQYLQNSKEQGEPEDYEIFVDAFKVVKRTQDLNRFETYSDYIQPETKEVTVVIYDGTSPRNTKHIFKLKEDADKQALSGLEIDSRINERIKAEKEKWETDLLRKENEELKQDLADADAEIEKLEAQLEQSKGNKGFSMGNVNVGEFASIMLEGMIRRNPQMLAKLPGGEALAGVIIQDNEEKEKLLTKAPEAEPEVTFSKGVGNTSTTLTEEEKAGVEFIKHASTKFSREQMTQVMLILDVLSQKPEDIDKTVQFLSDLHK
jgi:hypothetical protein